MPVTAIPFRSPPPFELPPHVLEEMRRLPLEAAAEQALDLLGQLDAADAQATVFARGAGLVAGPVWGGDAEAAAAFAEGMREIAAGGAADFMRQALEKRSALLLMGELEAGKQELVPAAIATHLLAGQPRAQLGFLYVLPLVDATGQAHGALALHRPLAAGPLNHDQPAIANALAAELAERAAAAMSH